MVAREVDACETTTSSSAVERRNPVGSVLVVDDDAFVRRTVLRVLRRAGHRVSLAANVAQAFERLRQDSFELVVLDIGLPDMSGLDFLRVLELTRPELTVVVMSADDRCATMHESLHQGATSFLAKPLTPLAIEAHVAAGLLRRRSERQERVRSDSLKAALAETRGMLDDLPRRVLQRVALAWDIRHLETGAHVRRIALYTEVIARALGQAPERAHELGKAAMFHDIGKLAVPDAVLCKPGRLTAEEFSLMKLHPTIGASMLRGFDNPFLDLAATVALYHHERWNGTGYPERLVGEACPESARIVGVVDVYDALGQARCYKPAWDEPAIREYFTANAGVLFEARLVDALIGSMPALRGIARSLPDEEPESTRMVPKVGVEPTRLLRDCGF